VKTVLIRKDRYVDGALGGAFESGLVTAILTWVARVVGEANECSS
jgi:hypothetical protein